MLRFLTAGESHGKALVMILEGLPAGLAIDFEAVTTQLRRRQGGYGRGRRMAIESDRAEPIAGIRHGLTTGAPVALMIPNKDWENWRRTMHVEPELPAMAEGAGGPERSSVTRPRPGHADLAGVVKYGHDDIRNVLERASARETASRVAVGAIARQLLEQLGTQIVSHVFSIGSIALADPLAVTFEDALAINPEAPLHCVDPAVERVMMAEIDRAREAGDTMGGGFEVIAHGVPPGLGSYAQWDRKLDGRLAQALMSVQAVKAVEIGAGVTAAGSYGSEVQDEIFYEKPARRFRRSTNRAGGVEGGITNGEDVIIRGYLKPISTLRQALHTADMVTKEPVAAAYERSDWCVVPAGAVAGEAMVALVLADAFLQKFGGDSLSEMRRNFDNYVRQIDQF
jgi:chorismate synthase